MHMCSRAPFPAQTAVRLTPPPSHPLARRAAIKWGPSGHPQPPHHTHHTHVLTHRHTDALPPTHPYDTHVHTTHVHATQPHTPHRTHMRTHNLQYTDIHTHPRTHAHAHIGARSHTHTLTCAQTRAHAHTNHVHAFVYLVRWGRWLAVYFAWLGAEPPAKGDKGRFSFSKNVESFLRGQLLDTFGWDDDGDPFPRLAQRTCATDDARGQSSGTDTPTPHTQLHPPPAQLVYSLSGHSCEPFLHWHVCFFLGAGVCISVRAIAGVAVLEWVGRLDGEMSITSLAHRAAMEVAGCSCSGVGALFAVRASAEIAGAPAGG